MRFIDNSVVV